MKPRPLLTERQVGMLAVLKNEVPGFSVIRRLAICFQACYDTAMRRSLSHGLPTPEMWHSSGREFREDTDRRHTGGPQRRDRALEQRPD